MSENKSKFNIKYINANIGEVYYRLRNFCPSVLNTNLLLIILGATPYGFFRYSLQRGSLLVACLSCFRLFVCQQKCSLFPSSPSPLSHLSVRLSPLLECSFVRTTPMIMFVCILSPGYLYPTRFCYFASILLKILNVLVNSTCKYEGDVTPFKVTRGLVTIKACSLTLFSTVGGFGGITPPPPMGWF